MHNHIRVVHQLGQQMSVLDGVQVILHPAGSLEVPDVFHASCGEVVEENYFVAAFKKTFRQMGADKTGAAGNQITQ